MAEQSASVQQFWSLMHSSTMPVLHSCCPPGHWQFPPGALLQNSPVTAEQSAFVQQVLLPMQRRTPPFAVHSFSPFGHWQLEPTAVQVSPWNLQSVLVQQVPIGMQMSDWRQSESPAGHTHMPPGPEQTELVGREQSALVQH
jgi:hypothetical protein